MDWLTIRNLTTASALWIGFVSSLFVLRKLVPGPRRQGRVLPDGTRKIYTLNGLRLFLIVAATVAVGQATDAWRLAAVHRLFWPLFVVANTFALLHTAWLFLGSRRRSRACGKGPGSALRDLWFGTELNPELWGVDLKMFAYVPSLLGLWLLNLSTAAVQWEELGRLTTRMTLYQMLTTIYVMNYFHFEYGMLHVWDVVSEKFGWMLIWGDYVLVPFFYSLASWYVLANLDPMPFHEVVALTALFIAGLCVFRGANEQKHRFKEDSRTKIWGRPAETIGGLLLVSGFWGIGRKLNYTGEIALYVSWTACTGGRSLVPYLLPAWLITLLVHRAWRDDRRCADKYGPLWDEYCKRARFRMVPFVY